MRAEKRRLFTNGIFCPRTTVELPSHDTELIHSGTYVAGCLMSKCNKDEPAPVTSDLAGMGAVFLSMTTKIMEGPL